MSHLLRYPNYTSPTQTVTLSPAFVTIQDVHITPLQRLLSAADGTQWVFQLSANLIQEYEVQVDALAEADSGGFSGFTTLQTFFTTHVTWMLTPFDLTHDDGGTVTVRLVSPQWTFTEGKLGRWSGSFTVRKVV